MHRPAHLVLEDGTTYAGTAVGAPGTAAGEACFTTAMAGYEQAVTDPSYARQVLAFTYPLVGNYGVDAGRLESSRVWTEGVVMRCARPAWSAWLAARGVVALDDVDTRSLVRRLREAGSMRCALGEAPPEELHARALAEPHLDWERARAEPELASAAPALEACVREPHSLGAGPRVVVLDLGCKRSIVRRLAATGVERRWGGGEPRLRDGAVPVEVRLGERPRLQLLHRRLAERAAHRARFAQAPDERARVDVVERDDAARGEPGRPGRPRTAHHDSLGPDPRRLEPARVDAVVADQGIGEREHLAGVARIGDGLLVARHRRREARLTGGGPGRADGCAGVGGAVLQDEVGFSVHRWHLTHISA